MGTTLITQEGWDVAVEATRNGPVEFLIVQCDGVKGGTLFFDGFNAGLLADAVAQAIEGGPQQTRRHVLAEAAGRREPSSRIVSVEGWRAAVYLNAEDVLELGLAAEDGCVALCLHLDRPNADLLAEGLRGGIKMPSKAR